MVADAEADVRVGVAVGDEAIGVLEDVLVAVGGRVAEQHLLAFLDLSCREARCPASRCAGSSAPATRNARSRRRRSGMSEGSSTSFCRSAGFSMSALMPPEIALRVVSLPAISSVTRNMSISSPAISMSCSADLRRARPPLNSLSWPEQAAFLGVDEDAHQVVARHLLSFFDRVVQVRDVLSESLGRTLHDDGIVVEPVAGDHVVGPHVEAGRGRSCRCR